MKIKLDVIEFYPYVIVNDQSGTECEISDALFAEWTLINTRFRELNRKMRQILDIYEQGLGPPGT